MATKTAHQTHVKPKTAQPKNYKVCLLNDDFTTMDFVVRVLMFYFGHDVSSAMQIMLQVHSDGKGVCGVYPYEIAETKAAQVREYAKANNFPLRCSVEEA
jgi:ATP-dependent Clp protease adaptor protein ClpS